MSFPFYKQYDSMDCGPACLRMVVKHFGRNIPIQDLRDKTQIGKEGVNLLGIREAAEAIGIKGWAVQINISSLISDTDLPAILHWNQNHFVVLYKIKRRRFFIADPSKGLISYTEDEFKRSWISSMENKQEEGIALLLQPTERFYTEANISNDKQPFFDFKGILKYTTPYKKLFLKILLATATSSLLLFILPFLAKSIMDKGIHKSDIHFISLVLLAQLGLLSGRLSIDFFRNRLLLRIGTGISLTILSEFLKKLMQLPIAFFDSKKTGDILQRMNDHSRIESFLTNSTVNTLFSIVHLIVFSIVLAVFNIYIFSLAF